MLKKWFLSLNKVVMSVAALLAATCAYSIPKEPCDDMKDKDMCCEKAAPGPYAFTYPKDIGLACPRDFYAYGSFLLMTTIQDGMDWAITNTNSSVAAGYTVPLTGGDEIGYSSGPRDWDWNYGVRAGFGFYLNHDAWEVNAQWTYLKINNDTGSILAHSGTLVPLWLPSGNDYYTTNGSAWDVSARWTAKFNALDIKLGKPFHVSRYFVADPNIGIKAAWIDQDFLVRHGYTGGLIEAVASNNYWGIGLKGGFDNQWLLGSGWHLYGNFAFSILYGRFDCDYENNYVAHPVNWNNDYYTNTYEAEIAFGLGYGHFCSKHKYMVSFRVGYEFQEWFDMLQLRKFSAASYSLNNSTVIPGNLSFNGFDFRLGCDF